MKQGKEQCGVTVDGGAGHRAGAARWPTEHKQVSHHRRAEQVDLLSPSPFLI